MRSIDTSRSIGAVFSSRDTYLAARNQFSQELHASPGKFDAISLFDAFDSVRSASSGFPNRSRGMIVTDLAELGARESGRRGYHLIADLFQQVGGLKIESQNIFTRRTPTYI